MLKRAAVEMWMPHTWSSRDAVRTVLMSAKGGCAGSALVLDHDAEPRPAAEASSAPDGWCVTPRKADVPRLKPWLCRRTAMMSSSRLMLSMHSIRSEYLWPSYGIVRF